MIAQAAIAVALVASAPAPRTFVTTGETGGRFTVVGNVIRKGGIVPSSRECNPTMLAVLPKAVSIRDGHFRYHGRMRGQGGRVTFSGTFVSRTAAKGRATITKGDCTDTIRWGANMLPDQEPQGQTAD